ncbi:ABC transporter permease [Aerococcus sp. 1KP-2016]|jgi:peptide/nickel transport system permease protein|uniref:ABC transporter permease n=1 Tax=Aerococcus sp. 1KP-2016 TaxID=1981982 RepID=UPI000B99220C|nr:ABC transporter permease [Aerococcus sp. 1KP-2016]OYQ66514.1 peptide ABC transporter permease [Aerococcus sp. 1KP-2016]
MENFKKTTDQEAVANEVTSTPPLGIRVIWREFLKDKMALFSLILLILIVAGVFIGAMVIDQDEVLRISLLDSYMPPGEDFILGTDSGGRSIFGQLIIGARNSIVIGFAITAITSIVGITVGLIAGYYGGIVDDILMRIIDFIMLLPTTMLIIVFITLVSDYNVWTFILVMSAFYWVGQARLIRSKALSESRRDYISASKTMGTPAIKILFQEILPNLSSLIIVNLTLNFAANIGIETGLSYLGFGLPTSTPSLGTLVSYAQSPDILENKTWVWLPASLLILVLMLCINYVGQALKRSADARQRLG